MSNLSSHEPTQHIQRPTSGSKLAPIHIMNTAVDTSAHSNPVSSAFSSSFTQGTVKVGDLLNPAGTTEQECFSVVSRSLEVECITVTLMITKISGTVLDESDIERHEAVLVLEAARAEQQLLAARKTLVSCNLQKHRAMARLYRHHLLKVEQQLEAAELRVVRVPVDMMKSEISWTWSASLRVVN